MNHSFITVRGSLPKSAKVEAMLREIVVAKWGDAVQVIAHGEDHWDIEAVKDPYSFGLGIWYENPRRIEMRKQMGDPSSWLQAYIQDSLAVRINGSCGDEGIPDRWKGDPSKFDTYEKWWALAHANWPDENASLIQKLWVKMCARLPKELHGVR